MPAFTASSSSAFFQQLAFGGSLLAIASLGVSPAGQSIGSILIVLAGIQVAIKEKRIIPQRHAPLVLFFGLAFLWLLLSYFWSDDLQRWGAELRIKLPLLLLPWAFSMISPFSARQKSQLSLAYLLIQVGIALLSVGNYLNQYQENLDKVRRNSSLEIFTEVNHIYFGVTLAFALLLGLHFLLRKPYLHAFFRGEKWIVLLLLLTGLLCLHTLTSRTGLLAFYGGLFTYILALSIRRKAYLLGAGLLAGLILLPVLSMQLIPSFRYRVQVTFWDMEVSQRKNADLDYKSVGLRLKTWEACWHLFQQQPLTGVGFGDLKTELYDIYEETQLRASRVRWLGSAHNQYLEQLAAGGIPAFLLLLLILLYPLFKKGWPPRELLTAFLALFAASMLTESMLERQLGITFFCIFLFLWMEGE
jgi:O-antigen ligase